MSFSEKQEKKLKDLESTIERAKKKVGAKKENELCKYIAAKDGDGYMHHFTFKKLKRKNPEELTQTIEKNINKQQKPPILAPKRRAPRGSRKFKDQFTFTRLQLERMRTIAMKHGDKEKEIDKEIIRILTKPKPLAIYKRELISLIKQGKVDNELWNSYAEAVNALDLAKTI